LISGWDITWVSVKTNDWRSACWQRIVPPSPGEQPINAAGLRLSTHLPLGRDAQAMAFFKTPGTP
jgi:hypothetical protein